MDWWAALGPFVAALFGASIGGAVSNWVTRREERRKVRLTFRIDAYRALSDAANRSRPTPEQRRALERAIADVILLGSETEVRTTREFLVEFARSGKGELDPLLVALRSDLRRELQLGETPVPTPYNLRFDD